MASGCRSLSLPKLTKKLHSFVPCSKKSLWWLNSEIVQSTEQVSVLGVKGVQVQTETKWMPTMIKSDMK